MLKPNFKNRQLKKSDKTIKTDASPLWLLKWLNC